MSETTPEPDAEPNDNEGAHEGEEAVMALQDSDLDVVKHSRDDRPTNDEE